MKVLVTGGTGFVGRKIVHELHNAGYQIRLLVRNPHSPTARELAAQCAAEIWEGNLLNVTSLSKAMQGLDAVIHLAGIISEFREQTFERLHTQATQNVVQSAVISGARRLVHMSALGARENAPSRYHQSKWAAEQAVRQSVLNWTIFRPSIIYGPGDGFVNLFAKIASRSPVVPLIGGGRSKFQPISVQDVAHCFVKSLTEPKSMKQTFDLCGNEVLTLAEIVDAILKATGRRRLKLPVPFSLARMQAALLEFIFPRLLGKAPPLNRDQLLMLQEDNVGNAEPAAQIFDLEPDSFADGIARYLKPKS